MTPTATPLAPALPAPDENPEPHGPAAWGWALRDAWTLARRELTRTRHAPGELVGALVVPGILVLLFGYVFGSAILTPGGAGGAAYREYLMPGLFAMVAFLGVMSNALGISKDITEGVMDRFQSMPTARAAVPLGQTINDLIQCAASVAIMSGIGLLVGWRAHRGLAATIGAYGLILLLRFALSWLGVFLGLSLTPETADAFVPVVFPVAMLSNAFVPTDAMPTWLRTIADWNPVSALVQACRDLFGNAGAEPTHANLALAHPYLATVGWSVLLLAIFVPLATWRYRTSTR